MERCIKKILLVICVLSIFTAGLPVAVAQGTQTNVTGTPTVTLTATPTQTVTTPAPTVVKEAKFRVGPTVRLRPVNDVINKSADGLIELYMDNPSLNDVTLNVDARISVPAGIHVYGEGFGQAGAAGTVYGTFSVPPGSARTIYLNIKAEKTGDFFAQFSGLYWPGDNKDAFNPISLTHPFKVYEASSNPNDPRPSQQVPGGGGASIIESYWWLIVLVLVVIVAIVALGRGGSKVEIEQK